jgi:hypothetical protein
MPDGFMLCRFKDCANQAFIDNAGRATGLTDNRVAFDVRQFNSPVIG